MRCAPCLFVLLLASCSTAPFRWQELDAGTEASFRGLSVVSDEVVWASGTGGAILRTHDGGQTWERFTPAGAEALDFRDIEAFDAQTAVAMAAGVGLDSRIFRTEDAGRSWQEVYAPGDPEAFLDALAFWDPRTGACVGDPDEDGFLLLLTEDGGRTWSENRIPGAVEGEHCFAASGTCLIAVAPRTLWLVTGGTRSRAFLSLDGGMSWKAEPIELPLIHGAPSQGAFSAVAAHPAAIFVVGGDYLVPEDGIAGNAFSTDELAIEMPDAGGFRSGITRVLHEDGAFLVTVGTSGTDWRPSAPVVGWKKLDHSALNVVAHSPSGRTLWAAGPDGALVRGVVRD